MSYCGPTTYRPLCHWVPTNASNIPPHAVHGGSDSSGETLYIGRSRHGNDVIPGKVVPSHGCCYVPWGGEENRHGEYEILIAQNESEFDWVPSAGGQVPAGAVQGGHTESGEPLFIGRHRHEGSLTIGKVQPSHSCCYISYGGQEISYRDYEVLVCRTIRLSY